MASIDELKERLARAAEIEDTLDRRLWVLAIITEYLAPKGVRPILVGGAAVEFYTAGGYATLDIDVIADVRILGPAMLELGFQKAGRHWTRSDIDIALEAPSEALEADPSRIVEMDMKGSKVYVIGVEDLIIDRLNAYVHWKSDEDGRWATHLLVENGDAIDWDYLNGRAEQERCADGLRKILEKNPEARR
ncbi:MAG: hypothetical protein M1133_11370 [Armatimonadetes bacterium]|nr:hypothetical protein [Armatimonadota bacterium]